MSISYPNFDGTQACAKKDVNLFFGPDEDNPLPNTNYREAKKMCSGCSFQLPCLKYAMSDPGLHGFWGGTSERERLELRRRMRKAAAA